jgi:hypothetical protein
MQERRQEAENDFPEILERMTGHYIASIRAKNPTFEPTDEYRLNLRGKIERALRQAAN